MKKSRLRVISLIIAVVLTLSVFTAVAVGFDIKDSLFNTNTPMYIKVNTSVTGTIDSSDDYEAYIFEVKQNGVLTVMLFHETIAESIKCGYIVNLYKIIENEEGRVYKELTYFESFWSETASNWGETGVTPGTYCVIVEPGADIMREDFTLQVYFDDTETFEKEPNDVKEQATPISRGYMLYGSSSQRKDGVDDDWFVLNLDSDSCVDISFVHEDLTIPKAGWNITILNDNDEIICDFTSKLTDLRLQTGTLGLRAGTYYIKVEAQSVVADCYSILVGIDKATNFEFEVNNTPETAVNLPQNIAISGSLADRILSIDKDYYKFTVPQRGSVNLYFSHPEIEGNKNGWNIRVLKRNDIGEYEEFVKKISTWNSKGMNIYNLGLDEGEYYLCVDADSLAYNSTTYSVKWDFTPRNDFEIEPNGSILYAESIDFNTYYNGAIISSGVNFDEDYYKFSLNKPTAVSLELGHDKVPDSTIRWTISIVDDKGNVKHTVESSLNEGLVSTGVVTLPAGVYCVKIETGLYGAEIPYYFRLLG